MMEKKIAVGVAYEFGDLLRELAVGYTDTCDGCVHALVPRWEWTRPVLTGGRRGLLGSICHPWHGYRVQKQRDGKGSGLRQRIHDRGEAAGHSMQYGRGRLGQCM